AIFDQTSGEVHATSQHVIAQSSALFNRTLRYQGVVGAAGNRASGGWVAPLGAFGQVDGDGNAARLEWWSAGLAGGYEGALGDHAIGGIGFGYIRSHGAVDDRLSALDSDGFYIGAYGPWADGT